MFNKDRAQLLQQQKFFRLRPKEQLALNTFNLNAQQALISDMASVVNSIRKSIEQTHPEHATSMSLDEKAAHLLRTLKQYRHIRIEGEDYPESQLARWRAQPPPFQARDGLFQSLSSHKLRNLPLNQFTESLSHFDAYGLISLAFAPEGKYFYHHLNNLINDTIQERANRSCQTRADFYHDLNQLDTAEFNLRMDQNTIKASPLYTQLVNNLATFGFNENDLACTDGKPLDFMVSQYLYGVLKKNKKKTWDNAQPFDITACDWSQAEDYHPLQSAAYHGSYEAASLITTLAIQKIQQSQTFSDALHHYNAYAKHVFPVLSQQYKAAGTLLFIHLKRVFAHAMQNQFATQLPQSTRLELNNILQKNICRMLILLEEQEVTHKNALRLYLKNDSCENALADLHMKANSPHPIRTPKQAVQHLRLAFPHLSDHFTEIENLSPLRNKPSPFSASTPRPASGPKF